MNTQTPFNIEDVVFPGCDLTWQMLTPERTTLFWLLSKVKPDLALEIGTYKGGSLQAISPLCREVYSVDPNPDLRKEIGPRFPNVKFFTGFSQDVLPPMIEAMRNDRVSPQFVLIDADHSRQAVHRDLEMVLTIRPVEKPMYVMMHDSFNAGCRAGMQDVRWSDYKHVHFVDLDFVHGGVMKRGEQWGGLALVVVLPSERTGPLTLGETHLDLQRAAHAVTSRNLPLSSRPIFAPVKRYLNSHPRMKQWVKTLLGRNQPATP